MQKITIASMAIGACASLPSRPAQAQEQGYALFPLSVLNQSEPHSTTRALTDLGEIVGSSSTDGIGFHAVMWDSLGRVTDLGVIAGPRSEARGVNSQLDIVGWSNYLPENSSLRHAFLYRDGQMIDLGTLGGEESEASAINDLGQIVGQAHTETTSLAFLWENGEMRPLPSLVEGRSSKAYAINHHGQIVGDARDEVGSSWAVTWENEQIIVLPHLGNSPSVALAVNDFDQIVGQSWTSGKTHAAAWVGGQVVDLHRNGLGQHSSAWGINDAGQIVGWVGEPPTNQQAFLWDQTNGMRTIDSVAPPNLRRNWTLTMAHDINEAGQIAAYGVESGHPLILLPFLVSPVQPSFDLSLPSPGTAGVANTITVSNVTPGARVVFLYSRHGGGTRIPGCDLQQNALQLDQPTIIGSAIADANGVATITRPVPLIARGQTILFQAVVQNECAISQLVVHEFQ